MWEVIRVHSTILGLAGEEGSRLNVTSSVAPPFRRLIRLLLAIQHPHDERRRAGSVFDEFSPFSGPRIATAEESPSVLSPSGPMTVTLLWSVSAMPVRGLIRCE